MLGNTLGNFQLNFRRTIPKEMIKFVYDSSGNGQNNIEGKIKKANNTNDNIDTSFIFTYKTERKTVKNGEIIETKYEKTNEIIMIKPVNYNGIKDDNIIKESQKKYHYNEDKEYKDTVSKKAQPEYVWMENIDGEEERQDVEKEILKGKIKQNELLLRLMDINWKDSKENNETEEVAFGDSKKIMKKSNLLGCLYFFFVYIECVRINTTRFGSFCITLA
jgi:hypothetical protein